MALVTWLALATVVVILVVMVYPDVVALLLHLAQQKREAEERAARVLAEILTPAELTHLSERGYLAVPSPGRPNRVYHVPRHAGMVSVYEGGMLTERLCVGATTKIPDGDVVVLHKLMIEGNEEEYLQLANHFSPRPYTIPM